MESLVSESQSSSGDRALERHVLSVEPGSLGALCPLRLQVGSMLPRLAVSVHTTVFRPFVKEPSGDSDAVGLSFCPVSLNSTGLWLLQEAQTLGVRERQQGLGPDAGKPPPCGSLGCESVVDGSPIPKLHRDPGSAGAWEEQEPQTQAEDLLGITGAFIPLRPKAVPPQRGTQSGEGALIIPQNNLRFVPQGFLDFKE